ncbi:glycosyltransferase family 4 protein [Kribbella sp. NPDC026611]|uniref:glycosyltransferase family 4 protein n=1 Tax=Kribbella sp. NPDC026611 TaxID=3154911 RepID=UPI0033F5A774
MGEVAPHVVMMVANDIVNDTRVLKEADALAGAGVRVTLFGVVRDGTASVERMGNGVLKVLVRGRFVLRDDRTRRRKGRRGSRSGEAVAALVARAARVRARRGDLKAAAGHAVAQRRAGQLSGVAFKVGVAKRVVLAKRWQVAAVTTRLRLNVARRQVKTTGNIWRRWDARTAKSKRVSWRTEIPEAYDYETIFGDILDKTRPDVIHAHDMHVIGVAARAAGRAQLRGHSVKTVYDAHEFVPGLSVYPPRTPRLIAAWSRHEAEFIRYMDRVVTVSPAIARALQQRHELPREPTVVMNSPRLEQDDRPAVPSIRQGIPEGVPLLVYSGGVTRARGVETAIQALPELPGVHLAVVCVPTVEMRPVYELQALAEKLDVDDRVHYLDPVPPDDVVPFLEQADIGLIPILRFPSHEMALPNKVFEYIFAGLPIVTSDMPSLQEFVRQTGIGEVFEAENPTDLAAAVTRVLEDRDTYRENATKPELLREVSWETQSQHLRDLYADLLGRRLAPTPPIEDVELEKSLRTILGI